MIKAIYGTRDILPTNIHQWLNLESIIRKTMKAYNYSEIRTPVFEETALFSRSIGENTDIVSKEMYTFTDRGETSITLRPELTASVVRAFIEHSFDKIYNLSKLYYIGPAFRQERPQAGRLRQFHQFGAEAIGCEDPSLDAEMIIMAFRIISALGLKSLTVKINSLGLPAERDYYREKLREYLKPFLEKLSAESIKRFDSNVLRIFDSKDERDITIMSSAPQLIDFLSESSLQHFETVKNTLIAAEIPYEIDPALVRGLDYYTHTTFEIVSNCVGSQSALCGGGRYNGLVAELGGTDAPGVGFAAGMERILLACENENVFSVSPDALDVYVCRINNDFKNDAFQICLKLRDAGFAAEIDYLQRSVKAQMREANRLNSRFVAFIGGTEFLEGKIRIKDMLSGTEVEVKSSDMESLIRIIRKD